MAGGEPLNRTRTGVLQIPDRRRLADELFELTGVGPGGVFGAARDKGPLTGDESVAGLAGGGGVDAGAVLELGERLLAVAGHDG
jgi:hypothetical protein